VSGSPKPGPIRSFDQGQNVLLAAFAKTTLKMEAQTNAFVVNSLSNDALVPSPIIPLHINLQQQISQLQLRVKKQAKRIKKQNTTISDLQFQLNIGQRKQQKPKHTTSSYLYYVKERHTSFAQAHPESNFQETSREITKEWHNMTRQEKQPYTDKGTIDKQRYKTEREAIEISQLSTNTNPTSSNALAARLITTSTNGSSKKNRKRKRFYNPGLPKKSTSAYLYYAQQRRPELKTEHPEWKFADLSKNLGKEWRSMDTEAKASFVELSAIDKTRYDAQMVRYRDGETFDKTSGEINIEEKASLKEQQVGQEHEHEQEQMTHIDV